jgi:hypothetical protein
LQQLFYTYRFYTRSTRIGGREPTTEHSYYYYAVRFRVTGVTITGVSRVTVQSETDVNLLTYQSESLRSVEYGALYYVGVGRMVIFTD